MDVAKIVVVVWCLFLIMNVMSTRRVLLWFQFGRYSLGGFVAWLGFSRLGL